ncbi:phage protein NinX family protein [Pseudomonas sp. NPDC096950]|uniref:phage protein NinX family protein n=1 Tax=Pseudomonas sp. NPDC096950 TaxID=3364485 RepID=UPI00383BC4C1
MSHSEIIIQIDESEGAALDWLVARVEQVKVFVSTSASGTTSCWRHDKPKQQFSPYSRWRECGPLLDKYDVTFSKYGGHIEAFCPTGTGNNQVSALGSDRRTAACRAIVKSFLGNVAVIPFVLSSAHAGGAIAQGKTECFDRLADHSTQPS